MKRSSLGPAFFPPFARCAMVTLTVASLFLITGCQPSESSKSKDSDAAAKDSPKDAAKDTNSGKGAKSEAAAVPHTSADETLPAAQGKPTSAQEVLEQMANAYHKADRYADAGVVRLKGVIDGQPIDEEVNFSVTLERPNKIRVQAYFAMLVSDGKEIHASLQNLPNQVIVKKAPADLTLRTIYNDRILTDSMIGGIAGALPQLLFLMEADPLRALLNGAESAELANTGGPVEGHDCYCVKIKRPDGTTLYWIDQESYVLRRITFPTDELQQEFSQQKPVEKLSLVADFVGAQLNGKTDPVAFEFQVPEGSAIVQFFVPPNPSQLLGKKLPAFEFFDAEKKPVTAESLAGKIVVFDFWAVSGESCKQSLQNLETVYQKYKGNDKVAFFAVNVDDPGVEDKDLAKYFAEWKVTIPSLRATQEAIKPFLFPGVPTTFLVGGDVIQDCEGGVNPKLPEELPEKIEKLLAGEKVYEAALKDYQEQLKRYGEALEKEGSSDNKPGNEPLVEEQPIAPTKTAEHSDPSTFKLTSLWNCTELKSPGNILVLQGKNNEPARLLVVENLKSLVEVGLDGKILATHPLTLDEKAVEVVTNLRDYVTKDGKRYVTAFASAQQRCHLLDENWKQVLSYPQNAISNPHSGIADVELADLNGDGVPQLCVGYWGVVGVQGVSLAGERLWSCRAISNVISMAAGAPNEKGQCNLFCTNNAGSLVALDGKGERVGAVTVPGHAIHWVVASDLRHDGQLLWCGLTAAKVGENVALGLSLRGEVLWSYPLPAGIAPQPIEPILSGKLTREGPDQWILPGPDSSIHVLSADGKLVDKFNYGEMLQGLATVNINSQPVLVVATPKGLEAWKID